MGIETTRIYLDSCLVIYLVEEHSAFYELVHRAIVETPSAEFCISSLVEMECLVGPLKLRDSELVASYENFFATMTRLRVPDSAYRTAAQLRANHGLKTPDALHLAIALYHGCDQLWSNDDRLARAAGSRSVNILAQKTSEK